VCFFFFLVRNRSVHAHNISNSLFSYSQMAGVSFLLEFRCSHDVYNESFCFLDCDAVQFFKYGLPFQRRVYHVPSKQWNLFYQTTRCDSILRCFHYFDLRYCMSQARIICMTPRSTVLVAKLIFVEPRNTAPFMKPGSLYVRYHQFIISQHWRILWINSIVLVYDIMQFSSWIQTVGRNILPPSSGLKIEAISYFEK
jgi:hypothetical protein